MPSLSEELQALHSSPNEQMRKIAEKFDAAFGGSSDDLVGAAVANLAASSNLVGVDGAGSNAAPLAGTETRLDNIETKLNALLTSLRNAGIIAA